MWVETGSNVGLEVGISMGLHLGISTGLGKCDHGGLWLGSSMELGSCSHGCWGVEGQFSEGAEPHCYPAKKGVAKRVVANQDDQQCQLTMLAWQPAYVYLVYI